MAISPGVVIQISKKEMLQNIKSGKLLGKQDFEQKRLIH